jgi:hypothetical protein
MAAISPHSSFLKEAHHEMNDFEIIKLNPYHTFCVFPGSLSKFLSTGTY